MLVTHMRIVLAQAHKYLLLGALVEAMGRCEHMAICDYHTAAPDIGMALPQQRRHPGPLVGLSRTTARYPRELTCCNAASALLGSIDNAWRFVV